MIRVAVFGALGKMGSTVCRAVHGDAELELVGGTDPRGGEGDLGEATGIGTIGIRVGRLAPDLLEARPDVAVDFTVAQAAVENLRWCAHNGVHAVVGTTGIGADELEELRGLFEASKVNCIVAPNFSVGAVLMMRMAELVSARLSSAEIVELHHDGKVDAPSGTALETARRIFAARASAGMSPTEESGLQGAHQANARGHVAEGGVRIHSVRLPGLVAHQEVVFGSEGEALTIRHDSYDRRCFMPGVLLAVKRVAGLGDGILTVGIEPLLGL
jgi:4-hydroxy-tetrahydrodipicolinate reductase